VTKITPRAERVRGESFSSVDTTPLAMVNACCCLGGITRDRLRISARHEPGNARAPARIRRTGAAEQGAYHTPIMRTSAKEGGRHEKRGITCGMAALSVTFPPMVALVAHLKALPARAKSVAPQGLTRGVSLHAPLCVSCSCGIMASTPHERHGGMMLRAATVRPSLRPAPGFRHGNGHGRHGPPARGRAHSMVREKVAV
jgi:hypothetical protein